jgi:hypothetical protein
MYKFLATLILAAGLSYGADVHFLWLPLVSNVPGIPQTNTPVTQYGIQVFMDSDNSAVTAFLVTLVVQTSDGQIHTAGSTVARQAKADGVTYSTLYSTWIDTNPNFQLLAVQVTSLTGVNITKPVAGLDYNNNPPPPASPPSGQ